MLAFLQQELPKLWTNEQYSRQFNDSPLFYKDFDHALKHILKAAVKLQNMVEEADHAEAAPFDTALVAKYLADIVISTVRAAVVCPRNDVDLERAVFERIEQKMGVRLEPK